MVRTPGDSINVGECATLYAPPGNSQNRGERRRGRPARSKPIQANGRISPPHAAVDLRPAHGTDLFASSHQLYFWLTHTMGARSRRLLRLARMRFARRRSKDGQEFHGEPLRYRGAINGGWMRAQSPAVRCSCALAPRSPVRTSSACPPFCLCVARHPAYAAPVALVLTPPAPFVTPSNAGVLDVLLLVLTSNNYNQTLVQSQTDSVNALYGQALVPSVRPRFVRRSKAMQQLRLGRRHAEIHRTKRRVRLVAPPST